LTDKSTRGRAGVCLALHACRHHPEVELGIAEVIEAGGDEEDAEQRPRQRLERCHSS
jgi:hypothetical protein